MSHWQYDISRHSLEEIVQLMERHGYLAQGDESRVLFCDTEGKCFFDESPDPYQQAITDLLNRRGSDGWELVQILFREKEFICFWKKAK